ncbi:MAG: nucleoside deaminase [Bacteroidota bacterium]
MMKSRDFGFLRRAIALAREHAQLGLDPFGAVLVLDGEIVAETGDQSVRYADPTAHAELILISEYCRKTTQISLKNHTLYSSTEPCVMCSGAIHWAKISRVVFSVSQVSLQQFSGGKAKPSASELIHVGGKSIEVVGPMLEEEGLAVFREFPFLSKAERRRRWEER